MTLISGHSPLLTYASQGCSDSVALPIPWLVNSHFHHNLWNAGWSSSGLSSMQPSQSFVSPLDWPKRSGENCSWSCAVGLDRWGEVFEWEKGLRMHGAHCEWRKNKTTTTTRRRRGKTGTSNKFASRFSRLTKWKNRAKLAEPWLSIQLCNVRRSNRDCHDRK